MLGMIGGGQRLGTALGRVPCVDPAGADSVDPDFRPKADRQSMGQGEQATLSRCIGFGVGFRLRSAGRGQVDDGAIVSTQVRRSEEHTSELQSLMRTSYAAFCLKKKKCISPRYKLQQLATQER